MQERKIAYSGPYSSFWTTISSLSLQLMISTQFTDQECLDWERSLRNDLTKTKSKIPIDPIIERLRDAPLFMLNELKSSFISSTIVSFTSTTEHYIKDMILLSLQRNSGFRKKAFANRQISAMELVENTSLNEIKKRIFNVIASEQSKGQLFTAKYKKASSFLSIKQEIINPKLQKSLDSIWELRNKMAHSNKGFIKTFEIISPSGLIKLNNESSKDEYFYFSVSLLNIIEEFTTLLHEWDNAIMMKWPANDFIK